MDPVTLGLSTQMELDAVVRKAADKKAKDDAKNGVLQPIEPEAELEVAAEEPEEEYGLGAEPTAESVFGSRD